jgi:hypothetical protein
MKSFTRRQAMIAIVGASVIGVLATAGCGRLDRSAGPDQQPAALTSELSWPAQALQSIGLDTIDLAPAEDPTATAGTAVVGDAVVASPANSASPSPGGKGAGIKRKHRLVRYAFNHGALHAEAVVKTDDGTKTVVVQRGTVTAIDAKSVTVKSADGFTVTWTFGNPITVIERRNQVQPSAIAVGATVGVAGEKSADATSARLIVVPNKTT